MKKISTSIIILTKNRAQLLEKNLSSLTRQIIKPTEIIIIDNNSTDKTSKVIKKYQRLLPIKYFKNSGSGYSKLYNFGIQKASSNLICFLDDDCAAEKTWLREILKVYTKNKQSVIQGQTYSLPKNNLYAQIMNDHYQNWLKSNLINSQELKFLDNKNAAIPKEILIKYGSFSEKQGIGSEDLELSIRLKKNGVKIIFAPKAIAWHHERDNFCAFVQQHWRIARSEASLDQNIDKNERIGIFPPKKTWLNVKSFVKRLVQLFKEGNLKQAIKAVAIYPVLFVTRIAGYLLKIFKVKQLPEAV